MIQMFFETLFYIIFFHIVPGILAFNHKTAIEQCRGHGGLASYRHFVGNEGRNVDESTSLGEGESAWISGKVRFSKFVGWHGCYTGHRQSVHESRLFRNNIYNCLENCSHIPNIAYIGLRNEFCFCIEWKDMVLMEAKQDDKCKPQIVGPNAVENIGDPSTSASTNINVYVIIDHRTFYMDPPLPNAVGQCVYVRTDGNVLSYGTVSCNSQASGFICINSAYQPLSTKCDKFYHSGTDIYSIPFCIVSKLSACLMAITECGKYSGKLVHHVLPYVKKQLVPYRKYWTGIFRSFKLQDEDISKDNRICISIRKVRGKVVLDPVTCLTEMGYICANDIADNTQLTTFGTTYSVVKTHSVSENSLLNTTIPIYRKSTKFSTTSSVKETHPISENSLLNTTLPIYRKSTKFRTTSSVKETHSVSENSLLNTTLPIYRKSTKFSTTSSVKETHSVSENSLLKTTIPISRKSTKFRTTSSARDPDSVTEDRLMTRTISSNNADEDAGLTGVYIAIGVASSAVILICLAVILVRRKRNKLLQHNHEMTTYDDLKFNTNDNRKSVEYNVIDRQTCVRKNSDATYDEPQFTAYENESSRKKNEADRQTFARINNEARAECQLPVLNTIQQYEPLGVVYGNMTREGRDTYEVLNLPDMVIDGRQNGD